MLGFRFLGFFGGLRSGHIDDDLCRFVVGLRDAAEEEIANVGHDRGAARGNAVLGNQDEEARKNVVNVVGGFKFLEFTDEGGTEVGFLADETLAEVVTTEAGVEVRNGHAAAATGRKRVMAASRVGQGFPESIGLRGLFVHFLSPMESRWVRHPGCFRKSGKQRTCGSLSA